MILRPVFGDPKTGFTIINPPQFFFSLAEPSFSPIKTGFTAVKPVYGKRSPYLSCISKRSLFPLTSAHQVGWGNIKDTPLETNIFKRQAS